MPLSLPHSPKSRVYGVLGGLAFIALVGCHHRSSVAAKPPTPENVKVGYGEQSRDQIGGAVESAPADKLSDVKRTQGEEVFEGRFPGGEGVRTPTGGFSIHIRGGKTILGNGEPLYAVDGIAP